METDRDYKPDMITIYRAFSVLNSTLSGVTLCITVAVRDGYRSALRAGTRVAKDMIRQSTGYYK